MAHDSPQGLLFVLLLIIVTACRADSPETVFVLAHREQDTLLPCFNSTVTDPKRCYRVRLVKYDAAGSRSDIFAWPKKNQEATRVNWKHDGDGQMSLYLTDVRKSDEGLYSCEVCQGWECILARNISLKVKDCKASPPLKAAFGKAILLNCSVENASGRQGALNISWVMLKGGKPAPVNFSSSRIKMNGTSLIFSSVEAADIGWYRCQLGQTQHCSDINLLIKAENEKASTPVMPTTQQALTTSERVVANDTVQSSRAFTAAVVIGLVVSAALIGLVLYFRRHSLRIALQTQRRPAGAAGNSADGYENVTLPEGLSVHENSLYEHFEHENLCTFQQ